MLASTLRVDPAAALEPREPTTAATPFRSAWPQHASRVWPGPEYWSNPLQDWRIERGALELVASGPDRNVQLLTRDLSSRMGDLRLSVGLRFDDQAPRSARGGFAVSVRGPLGDYRNNVIHGRGIHAGLTNSGSLFIGDLESASRDAGKALRAQHLRLAGEAEATRSRLVLSAHDADGTELLRLVRDDLPAGALAGNVALYAASEDQLPRGAPRLRFTDWTVDGSIVDAWEDRAFGPILFAQHTLSGGVLKMTAQLPPIGPADGQVVRLQVERGGGWQTAAESPIDPLSRTAHFRVADWDSSRDARYRLAYSLAAAGGAAAEHHFEGTIRRDPGESRPLVIAGLSCMVDAIFPNTHVVEGVADHDPDVMLFMGDQLYEATGGYGVVRVGPVELATLDYLRKWYMAGWCFGDLMRDRPSVCLTDDHDVYHGNIWGEGGKDVGPEFADHTEGGYFMPPEWVNMVQRTQAAHLPDPYDPTPVLQGIEVYYTEMIYGGVSFALLEDRKWKSGPEGLVPPGPNRPDHIVDPNFDPKALDVPGAVLLGERQLRFLDHWARERDDVRTRIAVSQTIFAQIPNVHGADRTHLVADLDSNGWPQTPRDEALRRFRAASAFHLAGDQHLPMAVRYGIDDWDDAGYCFCVPAIATGYPRWFEPPRPGAGRSPGAPDNTGRFRDGLANPVTVLAVANPAVEPTGGPLQRTAQKSSGYGIVRLDHDARTITMECWPMLSDPTAGAGGQFPGWPITIRVEDNG